MEAMTIVEHSKGQDVLNRAVVEIFAETSDVLAALPLSG